MCFVSCETTYGCFVFLLQAKGVLLCGVCRRNNKAYLIVEYCKKEIISDKKQSARMEKSVNIGKKTIQVSNFHNAAETDVNLTGRKQILI